MTLLLAITYKSGPRSEFLLLLCIIVPYIYVSIKQHLGPKPAAEQEEAVLSAASTLTIYGPGIFTFSSNPFPGLSISSNNVFQSYWKLSLRLHTYIPTSHEACAMHFNKVRGDDLV